MLPMVSIASERGSGSGRFLLRLPPALHDRLRTAASAAGLSLNEYCIRVLAAPCTDPLGPGAVVVAKALSLYGPDLVGVLLYGSWVRGEATATSDIDALVVLRASTPLTRSLYHAWDDQVFSHASHPIETQLVTLPTPGSRSSALWLEVALDAVVVHDPTGELSVHLSRVRHEIANGGPRRHLTHGQPHWTTPES